ncbi:MAG: helix-turn-helix transcriptional regulator [Anaerolineae bacterium]|nr:helix-turn-helix transcriptional regulator [Anaerolineae bacterium]
MADFDAAAAGLKALAHPVRLQILALLRAGETCVCHMEAALGKRQAYISQQLMILRDAGIIDSRKDGRQVFYWIVDDHARDLLDVLLGPAPKINPILSACPCPRCTTESAPSNLIKEENIHAHH